MTYAEFSRQFFVVLNAILDSIEKSPVTPTSVPKNWPDAQVALRRVAEDLMLCVDVKQAVEKLRSEQPIMQFAVVVATEMEDLDLLSTMERAYASTSTPTAALPGQSFAAFLLEVSSWPNPPSMRTD
jgi:hypothetical protein